MTVILHCFSLYGTVMLGTQCLKSQLIWVEIANHLRALRISLGGCLFMLYKCPVFTACWPLTWLLPAVTFAPMFISWLQSLPFALGSSASSKIKLSIGWHFHLLRHGFPLWLPWVLSNYIRGALSRISWVNHKATILYADTLAIT